MRWRLLLAATFCALALPTLPAMAKEAKTPDDIRVEGIYEGSATEIAAALRLREDGRFDYWLSYGAIDEFASGRWQQDGDHILLTSAPFKPPRFTLTKREPEATAITVRLKLPEGFPHEYFSVIAIYRSGEMREFQMDENGLAIDTDSADPITELRMTLPIYSLASEPVRLEKDIGGIFEWHFAPNEMGKVAFDDTPLDIKESVLILERHGRTVRFSRVE
ncbi:MAG: hypothetical protein R3E11_03805 [Sphingobium sp.]|nr:hypothetical protein [Sphingobium sp.]MCP5398619.1 hypothetical protein [Sphingomonas sp.]